jgi:hypothetical protein
MSVSGVEAGAAILRARFGCSVDVSRADARDILVASGYPAEVERLREENSRLLCALCLAMHDLGRRCGPVRP